MTDPERLTVTLDANLAAFEEHFIPKLAEAIKTAIVTACAQAVEEIDLDQFLFSYESAA